VGDLFLVGDRLTIPDQRSAASRENIKTEVVLDHVKVPIGSVDVADPADPALTISIDQLILATATPEPKAKTLRAISQGAFRSGTRCGRACYGRIDRLRRI